MTIPTGSTAITDPNDPTHQATVDSSGALKVAATFSAASVAIQDGTNASQKLAVDSNGKIGISSMPAVTATNPSVGTDGSAIPTSSTLIGASDGTNLQQLTVESASNRNLRTSLYNGANEASVSAGGALKVDGSGTTQPVSGTVTANIGTSGSLALETGGNLATLSGAVSSAKMQANVALVNGVAPSMGNGVSGTGVQRVTIASDSTGQVVLAAGAATIGSLAANQSTNVNQWAGATPSVSNPVFVSQVAQTGYVTVYGSNPSALTANTDASFKWGAGGTTVINHLMLQNNTAINVLWDLDVATTLGSPILGPNQTIFLDVQTTALHLQANGTPNLNGNSANNIVVRGWA